MSLPLIPVSGTTILIYGTSSIWYSTKHAQYLIFVLSYFGLHFCSRKRHLFCCSRLVKGVSQASEHVLQIVFMITSTAPGQRKICYRDPAKYNHNITLIAANDIAQKYYCEYIYWTCYAADRFWVLDSGGTNLFYRYLLGLLRWSPMARAVKYIRGANGECFPQLIFHSRIVTYAYH